MVHRPEVHAMPDAPLLPMASRLLAQLPGLRADPQMALLGELKALPPDDAAEAALQILEHMDESTGVLAGMTCANLVAEHGKEGHLPRLEAARQRVPPFPGLRDWRRDVGDAVEALQALAKKRCRCSAARTSNTAPSEKLFETLSSKAEDYVDVMEVRCRHCGCTYQVERDDSYHYPTFSWR